MSLARAAALFLCASKGVACFAATETAIPVSLPAERYQQMIKQSPFAPATAVTAPVANAGFAASFYVSGVAKIGSQDFVTIASRDGQTRFSLAPGEEGPDGITITKVDWSDQPGKSKVTMKKGNETGIAEFDEAAMQKPAAVAPQPPAIPMGVQGMQPGRVAPRSGPTEPRPPQLPQFGQATRINRPAYPQAPTNGNPQTGAPTTSAQVPGGPPPVETRRRVRIINPAP
jgi:hypothetical protein